MKLISIKLYKYNLLLKRKISLGGTTIKNRNGFIIELISETNNKAISEISPLPNFSKESQSDVITQVQSFKSQFIQKAIPSDILQQLSSYAPSVRFGIESAFLQLTAQSKELLLVDLLNPTAKQVISVNALLAGTQTEIIERASQLYDNGYKAFKIKIGRTIISDEINTIIQVRKAVGENSLIRLDANRAFDMKTAIDFFEKIQNLQIDYIEEPFNSFETVKQYFSDHHDKMPIAFDETLTEIEPDDLNQFFALKAVVLKPTLLGYTKTMMFAKKAFSLGIQPVISSSFETSIGTSILASMGAIIDSKTVIGLDSLSWFADDLVSNPVLISEGKIDISTHTNINSSLDFTKLTEVSLVNK